MASFAGTLSPRSFKSRSSARQESVDSRPPILDDRSASAHPRYARWPRSPPAHTAASHRLRSSNKCRRPQINPAFPGQRASLPRRVFIAPTRFQSKNYYADNLRHLLANQRLQFLQPRNPYFLRFPLSLCILHSLFLREMAFARP